MHRSGGSRRYPAEISACATVAALAAAAVANSAVVSAVAAAAIATAATVTSIVLTNALIVLGLELALNERGADLTQIFESLRRTRWGV
jgi:hypothetical protein